MVRLEERLLHEGGGLDQQRSALDRPRGGRSRSTRPRSSSCASATCASSSASPGLSASQAKQILLRELEDQIRHECARKVRQIEEETKRDADRRVRNILSVVHAADGGGPRGRDDGVRRPALRRRHEGPHHRPRGPQHPRPRAPHRRRLHHRRHAQRGDPLRLRRRPARDRPHDAREAAAGRAHPPGADRGDLLPGQVRAREPHDGGGGAGLLRRQRRRPRPRDDPRPRPAEVPHQLRPERARPLGRVRAPGRDDGRTSSARRPRPPAAPRCCTTSARPSRTRSRARTRWSAATSPASTASPRPSRTRWRRTTTRSSRRPSRP